MKPNPINNAGRAVPANHLSWRPRLSAVLSRARGVPVELDLEPWRRRLAGEDPVVRILRTSAAHSRELLGLEPFETQLIAALAMHEGWLAQVQTGEGKTLAAALAVIPHALAGRKVHVLTANDYLATRDAAWMGPLFRAWGLRVDSITAATPPERRRDAYAADILYLTAREAGFDFLRDGLACREADRVQGPLDFVLVDEADFLLIDEARIPMVIAGDDPAPRPDLERLWMVADQLLPMIDLMVDPQGRRVGLTLAGQERAARLLGLEGPHHVAEEALWAGLHAALHARFLVRRDVDYIVRDGRIELVDEFTGRVAALRRLPWGVQAALETREGLAAQAEGRVYASITTRDFIGQYAGLAAMTATAWVQAAEFHDHYGLGVLVVPPHRPVIRVDLPDRVFATAAEKRLAVVEEIRREHRRGRPVLVGTATVRESEDLAGQLQHEGIHCVVLNASHDRVEADLVARAGRLGAVTIATNMAGRGTDIALDPEHRDALLELGGLYVIGTNRHESRRIDDQLRGRAGRQGDPGQSRFFLSLEDPLFVRYGVKEFLPADVDLEDPRVLAEIDRAQRIIAGQNGEIRATLHRYNRLVEHDRRHLYVIRATALATGRLPERLADMESTPAPPVLVQLFLAALDRFWSDHLQRVEDLREGIALQRYGGRDPWLEFNRLAAAAFDQGWATVLDEVAMAWQALPAEDRSLDQAAAIARAAALGIRRPSATWTYLVSEEAGPAYKLSMIASSNIGAAALAAFPCGWARVWPGS